MLQHDLFGKIVATIVVVALQALMVPVLAAEAPASLRGAVVSTADQAPLAGARLHAGDPKSGRVYTSEPTGSDGEFSLGDLPAATYEVAVQTGDGLFIAGSAVRLAPGQARAITVALDPQMADDPKTAGGAGKPAKGSLWSNPATAALIVLGAAIVLGVVIDQATDDNQELLASP